MTTGFPMQIWKQQNGTTVFAKFQGQLYKLQNQCYFFKSLNFKSILHAETNAIKQSNIVVSAELMIGNTEKDQCWDTL